MAKYSHCQSGMHSALQKKDQLCKAMTLRWRESHFDVTITLSMQNFIWRCPLICLSSCLQISRQLYKFVMARNNGTLYSSNNKSIFWAWATELTLMHIANVPFCLTSHTLTLFPGPWPASRHFLYCKWREAGRGSGNEATIPFTKREGFGHIGCLNYGTNWT